jgi:hypothetical protein
VTGEIVRTAAGAYVRCAEGTVASDRDVLELFERCFELDSARMVGELRRGTQIRFFESRAEAEAWLCG